MLAHFLQGNWSLENKFSWLSINYPLTCFSARWVIHCFFFFIGCRPWRMSYPRASARGLRYRPLVAFVVTSRRMRQIQTPATGCWRNELTPRESKTVQLHPPASTPVSSYLNNSPELSSHITIFFFFFYFNLIV